jgi:hypothetical protein
MADDEPMNLRDAIEVVIYFILVIIATWLIMSASSGCEYCV